MADAQSDESKAGVQEGEDSMEEILHSIRDIIANEGEAGKDTGGEMAEEKKEPAPQAQPKEEEPLELTDVVEEKPAEETKMEEPKMEEPAAGGDILDNIDAALEEEAPAPEAEPEPEATPAPEPESAPPPAKSENLVSEPSAKATASELKKLVDNIPKPEIKSAPFRSGNTVEDLVVEAIKPMLSEWLNKNLPTIVKEAVEKEIRKLVPRE